MQYNYKVPCAKKNLVDIRDFINKALQNHFDSEIDIHSMVLAVDEVCANLMIHSHNCNPNDSLELFVEVQKQEVVFEIRDTGNGFNFKDYREPTIQEIISEKKKGGIGLLLVKRIMDKIEFIQNKNTNICRLKKKFFNQ